MKKKAKVTTTKMTKGKAATKTSTKVASQYPMEWLYLNTNEIELLQVKEVFNQEESVHVDYWEAAHVIELEFNENNSMDIEVMEISKADEYSRTYCENHGIKTAYIVTVKTDDESKIQSAKKKMVDALGGFFTIDDGGFMPA